MRGRDDDAVGKSAGTPAVVGQDGMRDHRRGDVPVCNADFDPVRGEDFDGRHLGRFRQRVGILADEQRPRDAVLLAIFHQRLANREDMIFVEAASVELPR